ncbi:MAG: rubrerythrin family protein [Chloroflexi bacterium]|nr:rubrerythrin family protein [Chloroflexota bacterium]
MKKITEANLNNAYAGESMAHMRYSIYSDVAEQEGLPNVSRLFRAIAFAEKVHATNHYRELRNIGESPRNLQIAIDGETFEVEEMYPSYRAVAELQGEKGALRSTDWALQAEKIHAAMYRNAREATLRGQDVTLGTVHICQVCGHTVEGEAPDQCPVCQSLKDKFRAF